MEKRYQLVWTHCTHNSWQWKTCEKLNQSNLPAPTHHHKLKSRHKLLSLNARSLCDKIRLFFLGGVRSIEPDLISVTETWAHSLLCDGVFSIAGYNLFCKDLINRGSGVIVYVRSNFSAIHCVDLNQPQKSILLQYTYN